MALAHPDGRRVGAVVRLGMGGAGGARKDGIVAYLSVAFVLPSPRRFATHATLLYHNQHLLCSLLTTVVSNFINYYSTSNNPRCFTYVHNPGITGGFLVPDKQTPRVCFRR